MVGRVIESLNNVVLMNVLRIHRVILKFREKQNLHIKVGSSAVQTLFSPLLFILLHNNNNNNINNYHSLLKYTRRWQYG